MIDVRGYVAPDSIDDAIGELVDHPEARLLAGGTDLLVQLRAGVMRPGPLVDIKRVGLTDIRRTRSHLEIGALATHAMIAGHPDVNESCRILAEAARCIGGPATRNRGTLAGNIINASPAADAVVALMALDAVLHFVGPTGQRSIPIGAFYQGYRQVAAAQAEILVRVDVPLTDDRSSGSFRKVGLRNALVIAVASVACHLVVGPNQVVKHARIAFGSLGPTVMRARVAEAILEGQPVAQIPMTAAVETAKTEVQPITDLRATDMYRRRLAGVWLRRALEGISAELKGNHG